MWFANFIVQPESVQVTVPHKCLPSPFSVTFGAKKCCFWKMRFKKELSYTCFNWPAVHLRIFISFFHIRVVSHYYINISLKAKLFQSGLNCNSWLCLHVANPGYGSLALREEGCSPNKHSNKLFLFLYFQKINLTLGLWALLGVALFLACMVLNMSLLLIPLRRAEWKIKLSLYFLHPSQFLYHF